MGVDLRVSLVGRDELRPLGVDLVDWHWFLVTPSTLCLLFGDLSLRSSPTLMVARKYRLSVLIATIGIRGCKAARTLDRADLLGTDLDIRRLLGSAGAKSAPAAPRARFAALSRTSAVRCADQIGQSLPLWHAELPPVLGVTRVHAPPSRFLLRSHRHTVGDDAPGVRGDSRTSVVPVLRPY